MASEMMMGNCATNIGGLSGNTAGGTNMIWIDPIQYPYGTWPTLPPLVHYYPVYQPNPFALFEATALRHEIEDLKTEISELRKEMKKARKVRTT